MVWQTEVEVHLNPLDLAQVRGSWREVVAALEGCPLSAAVAALIIEYLVHAYTFNNCLKGQSITLFEGDSVSAFQGRNSQSVLALHPLSRTCVSRWKVEHLYPTPDYPQTEGQQASIFRTMASDRLDSHFEGDRLLKLASSMRGAFYMGGLSLGVCGQDFNPQLYSALAGGPNWAYWNWKPCYNFNGKDGKRMALSRPEGRSGDVFFFEFWPKEENTFSLYLFNYQELITEWTVEHDGPLFPFVSHHDASRVRISEHLLLDGKRI